MSDGRAIVASRTDVRDQPDEQEIGFLDDLSELSHTKKTCRRRGQMTRDMDTADGTTTRGGWGVSDPVIAWGEVGRPKPSVAHAPVLCTDISAHRQRAAKNAARSVSAIAARWCVTSSSPTRAAARIATTGGSPIRSCRRRRGTAHPETFIPPVLRSSASDLPRKNKEMLVDIRQLQALDARTATVQAVARHR
jgi:hypothetical protein